MNFLPILLIGTLALSSSGFWTLRLPSAASIFSNNGNAKAAVFVAANHNNENSEKQNDKKDGEKKNEDNEKPRGILKRIFEDVVAPLLKKVEVKATTENSARVDWKTNEKTTGQVNFGTTTSYGSQTSLESKLSKSHKTLLSGLAANTTYHFQVVAKDKAGNETKSADMTLTTKAEAAVDVTAPSIFNIAVTGETQQSVVVRWTTSEPATSQVEYGTTAGYGQSTNVDSELRTNHEVKLAGLSANTTYHFKVESKDGSGNLSASGDSTLTTRADVTLPRISSTAVSAVTTTSAEVTWKTNEPASSQLNYGTTALYGSSTTLDTALVTKHKVTLAGLSEKTTYHLQVLSRDANGNLSASSDATFTTGDATAPVLSGVSVSATTDHSATIKWSTDEPTTAQVKYGTTTAYGSSSSLSTTLSTSHEVTLSGLSANITYHFKVESKDGSGNISVSADATLTTAVDTTLPTISNIEVTSLTRTSAIIRWDTNEPTSSKLSYNAGATFDASAALIVSSSSMGTKHAILVMGLEANTTYPFVIESKDASSNVSTSTQQKLTTRN